MCNMACGSPRRVAAAAVLRWVHVRLSARLARRDPAAFVALMSVFHRWPNVGDRGAFRSGKAELLNLVFTSKHVR